MAQAIPDVSDNRARMQQNPAPQQAQQNQMAQRQPARKDDNIVYVGKKPTMSYVLAVMTQIQSGMPEIHIRARGKSISKAVDISEVVKNRFLQNVRREVQLGTESITDKDNRPMNVSTISIKMTK